jgi:hypothetical protein
MGVRHAWRKDLSGGAQDGRQRQRRAAGVTEV